MRLQTTCSPRRSVTVTVPTFETGTRSVHARAPLRAMRIVPSTIGWVSYSRKRRSVSQ